MKSQNGYTLKEHHKVEHGTKIDDYYYYDDKMNCLSMLYIGGKLKNISTYINMKHRKDGGMMGKVVHYGISENDAIQWFKNPTKQNEVISENRELERLEWVKNNPSSSDDLPF